VDNLTPWLLYALERTLVPTGEEGPRAIMDVSEKRKNSYPY